jgi:multidrug resistance efflux pump
VATVADLSGWLVETTDLSELDVPAIAVGDAVQVRFDAIPDLTLAGVVTKIVTVIISDKKTSKTQMQNKKGVKQKLAGDIEKTVNQPSSSHGDESKE